jgi:hypothetical protein
VFVHFEPIGEVGDDIMIDPDLPKYVVRGKSSFREVLLVEDRTSLSLSLAFLRVCQQDPKKRKTGDAIIRVDIKSCLPARGLPDRLTYTRLQRKITLHVSRGC